MYRKSQWSHSMCVISLFMPGGETALHPFRAELISVTYGRFLPSGCHANVGARYEFLNMFDWKGNRILQSVWRKMWVFSFIVFAHIFVLLFFITLLLWVMPCDRDLLTQMERVHRQTVCVASYRVHAPLRVWCSVQRASAHMCQSCNVVERPLGEFPGICAKWEREMEG